MKTKQRLQKIIINKIDPEKKFDIVREFCSFFLSGKIWIWQGIFYFSQEKQGNFFFSREKSGNDMTFVSNKEKLGNVGEFIF